VKKTSLITGLAALLLMLSAAGLMAQDLYIGGYVRNNTGVFVKDADLSQFVNTLDLKFGYNGNMTAMNAEVFMNVTDDIDELAVGVRELYMDVYFNAVDLRIGKQKIVWGKGDGVFITDVVSPLDLSQFLTQEFEEIRLGVTALKADWYVGPFTFEGIWIPVYSSSLTPEADSPWNTNGMLLDAEKPGLNLANSEGFAKISYMGSMIDVELMGGYMWDDVAVGNANPVPPTDPDDPKMLPAVYDRIGLVGGSFSTDLFGLIFRGEGAFYIDKNFTVGAPPPPAPGITGVVKKNYLNYMFGLDYPVSGFMFSTQFIQKVIFDYDDSLAMYDEFSNMMTFLVSKTLMGETLKLEFFSYFGMTNLDAMLRFRTYYDIADGLEWIMGADVFVGDEAGGFGQYGDNSMVYTKLTYSF